MCIRDSAGDVYDKSVPSGEAMGLFDDFLNALLKSKAQIFIVAGNHDAQERLGFGRQIMKKQGVYIAGAYAGRMERVRMQDEYGPIDLWMLPYIRPREAAAYLEGEISRTGQAIQAILSREAIDFSGRNLLIAHQFVTSAAQEVIPVSYTHLVCAAGSGKRQAARAGGKRAFGGAG